MRRAARCDARKVPSYLVESYAGRRRAALHHERILEALEASTGIQAEGDQ